MEEKKKILIKNSCAICSHINICKYHNEAEKFAYSPIMHSLSEYECGSLILQLFERISTHCGHYDNILLNGFNMFKLSLVRNGSNIGWEMFRKYLGDKSCNYTYSYNSTTSKFKCEHKETGEVISEQEIEDNVELEFSNT